MKEALLIKINAINLIIETIRKSLDELELKMNFFEYKPLALHYLKLPNGNYHQLEMRSPRCYNCKHASKGFKILKLTHHHCCDPSKYTQEKWDNGEFTAWDTLRIFDETCDNHEYKSDETITAKK